jgi:hypothetical protein
MGRTLSSPASHTSPLRAVLAIGFGLSLEGFLVGLISQARCGSELSDAAF